MTAASDLVEILALARLVRTAFEITHFGSDGILTQFPRECCEHACSLLRIFFDEAGIGGFEIIEGNRPGLADGQHLWLQRGDIIVDITADQFDHEGKPSVVVTEHSPWHDALNGMLRPRDEEIDVAIRKYYDEGTYSVLQRMRDTLTRLQRR